MYSGLIWMFHRIATATASRKPFAFDDWFRVSCQFLEDLIVKAKSQGYRFVSMDEFLAHKETKKDIVITIDDGGRDIYQYAYPLFKKHMVPFTFYIATCLIASGFRNCGSPEADGTDALMDVIATNEQVEVNGVSMACRTGEEKQKVFELVWSLYEVAMREPQADGREVLSRLLRPLQIDFDRYMRAGVCSVDELRELANDPLCTIGAHSVNHRKLTEFVSPKDLEFELAESRRILESWTGKQVRHFCYPYGKTNATVMDAARRHYESATSVFVAEHYSGLVMWADDNMLLPRIFVRESASEAYLFGRCSFAKSVIERMLSCGPLGCALRFCKAVVWRKCLQRLFTRP